MEEIATGFDVHAYTAKVITDAGNQHHVKQLKNTRSLRSLEQAVMDARKLKQPTTPLQREVQGHSSLAQELG